jgi:hypothetical protein
MGRVDVRRDALLLFVPCERLVAVRGDNCLPVRRERLVDGRTLAGVSHKGIADGDTVRDTI